MDIAKANAKSKLSHDTFSLLKHNKLKYKFFLLNQKKKDAAKKNKQAKKPEQFDN